MVQAGAMLVEEVMSGLRMPMQAEQLPSLEREHRVVITPDVLVLVENGLGREQVGVPASTSPEIGDSHSDMGEGWKLRHSGLLIDGGNFGWQWSVCRASDDEAPTCRR
jgi:hypothetical protein